MLDTVVICGAKITPSGLTGLCWGSESPRDGGVENQQEEMDTLTNYKTTVTRFGRLLLYLMFHARTALHHTAHGLRGVKVANFGRFRKHLCAVSPCAPVITIIYALILRFVHDHGAFCQPASQPVSLFNSRRRVPFLLHTHTDHRPAFVRSRHTVLPNQLLQTFFRWAVIDSVPGVVPWHRAR